MWEYTSQYVFYRSFPNLYLTVSFSILYESLPAEKTQYNKESERKKNHTEQATS